MKILQYYFSILISYSLFYFSISLFIYFYPYDFYFSLFFFSPPHTYLQSPPLLFSPPHMYPHSSLLFFFSFLPSSLAQRDGERPQHTRERRPVEIESSRKEKASKDWFSPCNTTLSASPPPLVLLPTTRVGQIGLSFFIFLFSLFSYSDSTLLL